MPFHKNFRSPAFKTLSQSIPEKLLNEAGFRKPQNTVILLPRCATKLGYKSHLPSMSPSNDTTNGIWSSLRAESQSNVGSMETIMKLEQPHVRGPSGENQNVKRQQILVR
jgi:hypothetical protein